MASRIVAVAGAHARILARRRTTFLLLGLLPLAFYAALYRHSDHAIAVGGVASAFSAGGAGIFSMLPTRAVDRRLVLVGYRPSLLVLGRLIVLEAVSLAISVLTSVVMIAGTSPHHPAEVFAGVVLVGAVAVPLGLALGALLARELEATLVLIGIVGIQLTGRSDSGISRLLPFHAAEQMLQSSVGTPVSIWPRLIVSVGYGVALLAIAWLAWLRRIAARGARGRNPVRDHGEDRVEGLLPGDTH
jgi:hypothetical protein